MATGTVTKDVVLRIAKQIVDQNCMAGHLERICGKIPPPLAQAGILVLAGRGDQLKITLLPADKEVGESCYRYKNSEELRVLLRKVVYTVHFARLEPLDRLIDGLNSRYSAATDHLLRDEIVRLLLRHECIEVGYGSQRRRSGYGQEWRG